MKRIFAAALAVFFMSAAPAMAESACFTSDDLLANLHAANKRIRIKVERITGDDVAEILPRLIKVAGRDLYGDEILVLSAAQPGSSSIIAILNKGCVLVRMKGSAADVEQLIGTGA